MGTDKGKLRRGSRGTHILLAGILVVAVLGLWHGLDAVSYTHLAT